MKWTDQCSTKDMRNFIIHLGGDPNILDENPKDINEMQTFYPFIAFCEYYPHLYEKAKKFFEETNEGNPANAVYYFTREAVFDTQWAENTIAEYVHYEVGDPSEAIIEMISVLGSSVEWGKELANLMIINGVGDPSKLIHLIAKKERDWAMKELEYLARNKIGDPSTAIVNMVLDGKDEKEWAKKLIEDIVEKGFGNPTEAICMMKFECNIDYLWAIDLIEKAVENGSGDPAEAIAKSVFEADAEAYYLLGRTGYLKSFPTNQKEDWFDVNWVKRIFRLLLESEIGTPELHIYCIDDENWEKSFIRKAARRGRESAILAAELFFDDDEKFVEEVKSLVKG